MRERVRLQPPDVWLILAVVALVIVGLFLVYDASYAKAADSPSMNNDPGYLAKRQAVFVAIGFGCMYLASLLSFRCLRVVSVPIVVTALVLLVIVLLVGHTAHGARSWCNLGPVRFQPSELAKIGLVLYLAGALSSARTFARRKPKRWVVPALVSAGVIALIVLERDLGTAALLSLVTVTIFYAAGARLRYIVLTCLAVGVIAVGVLSHVPHCKARWRAFSDPWAYRFGEGYQTVHSLAGISSGGLLGVGLCEGRTKFYMPAASTDYIFATLVEETGVVGGVALISLFLVYGYRGMHIAHRSKSAYGSLLATGVVSMVGIQAGINLAVVTASIPPTGLSLPFISYGGSGMLAMLTCTGIVLAVSKQVDVGGDQLEADQGGAGRRWNGRARVSGYKRSTGSSGLSSSSRVASRR